MVVTKIGQLFRELCKKTQRVVCLLNAVFAVKTTDWLTFIKYRQVLIVSSSQGTNDHNGVTIIRQGDSCIRTPSYTGHCKSTEIINFLQ